MPDSKRPDDDGPTENSPRIIRAEYDWSEVAPSTAVVETVAIAAGQEHTELEPLYETVDPDALDELIRSRGSDPTDEDVTVAFALDCYEVTVDHGGIVVVRPDAAGGEPG